MRTISQLDLKACANSARTRLPDEQVFHKGLQMLRFFRFLNDTMDRFCCLWLDQGELFKMMIKKQYWNIGCPFFGEDRREIEVFDKRR